MSDVPYTPPAAGKTAFHCPHCAAYSRQDWFIAAGQGQTGGFLVVPNWKIARCAHCNGYSFWLHKSMIYPDSLLGPSPSTDLPSEIVADFNEARSIIERSPRGAAALFRLCIQKLCVHLGEQGRNLNDDIGSLVKKGLNPKIQKSLDIVRVIGNESVHPGTMDLRDKPETAIQLAQLINLIAETMITQPKIVDELYKGLPETKKKEIERRDGTAPA